MLLHSYARILVCLVAGFAQSVFPSVFSNVPEATDYQPVYQLDIPLTGGFRNTNPVPYTVANTAGVPPFDRIAYYLELVNHAGATNWVYASMDAFTTNAAQIGLPHNVNNPVSWQLSVTNLTVFANVAGVQNGDFDTGNVEMWSSNYSPTNSVNVFGGSSLTFDWGDTPNPAANPGYGSFQVHNHEALQVVFAYNGWASGIADGNTNHDDVGIGNQPSGNPDWTYAINAGAYAARTLLILVRPQRFQVAFTALPRNHQVTPRNLASNLATLPIQGTESSGEFDGALLRLFRNGVQQGRDILQPLQYTNGSAQFSFSPQIPAELASSSLELYLTRGSNVFLARRVSDVVAGDVFAIYGQSNAEAKSRFGSGTSVAYNSSWIRTFGEASDSVATTTNYLFWVQANGDGCRDSPGGVGQWPLVMASQIVNAYQIPIALFNGARDGYSMPQLQRNDRNPDDLTSGPYDRLRYRTIKAGVNSAVRAMLFYQGESDYDDVIQHTNGFASLHTDWRLDYPAVESIFVTQLHVGCDVTWGDVALRDAQRRFSDVYPDVRVMSANALPGHIWCHYLFSGYEQHGFHLYRQLARTLYGAPNAPNIDPPNPLRVEFANATGDRVRIVLRTSGDSLGVDPMALSDFRLGGDHLLPISSTVTTNAIELQYPRPVTGATNLSYLAHAMSGPGWVTNANGVGLLSFSEGIANPFPQASFISPAGTCSASPGQSILVSAQATSLTGIIARLELRVDGILYAALNNTNFISTSWTVPPQYAHRLTVVAFDGSGNQVQRSLVVFAGVPPAPGVVTTGLNAWLRPQTGMVWNGPGLVSAWQDSSGRGNDFAQVDPMSQPRFTEGLFGDLPGLVFSGRQFLAAANAMSTNSYSKVVRFQLSNWYQPNSLLCAGPTTGTGHGLFCYLGPYPSIWHGAPFLTGTNVVSVAQSHVLTTTYDGATRQGVIYLDGAPTGTGTAKANNSTPSCLLGAYPAGFLVGAVGEALVYDRVLTPVELTNLWNYLSTPAEFPPTNSVPAYWINTTTAAPQSWDLSGNWASTLAFPNGPGATVVVNADIPTVQTINLDQAIAVGSLSLGGVNGTSAYTITGNGGMLTFDNWPQAAVLTELASSAGDTITSAITLNGALLVANNSTNELTLSGAVAGPISANLALSKGSLLLLGTNSYGGLTTISGGLLQIGGGGTSGTLGPNNVVNNGTLVFNRSDVVNYGGVISGKGTLVQQGTGTLALSGANTYSGPTFVNAGTLAITGSGSLANTPNIYLASGAVLDVSETTGSSLVLSSGQSLMGSGLVNGNLTIGPGATMFPGPAIGTLTLNNALTTRGTTLVEVSKLPRTNNVVHVLGTLTFGGTLVVTNVGSTPLASGDSFKVFEASNYNGAFSSIVPSTPGSNLLWNASTLVTDGTLSVIACCTNNPPVLASISNQMVMVGTSLTITNVASDPDSPPEVLTFSLGAGAATNASINVASGVFAWTPLNGQLGTNIFSVVVTDSGLPPLSATQSFAVVVVPNNTVRGRVTENLLGTNVVLTWSEPSAILQSATNVVGPYLDVPGSVSPWSNAVPGKDQMFFRLRYP